MGSQDTNSSSCINSNCINATHWKINRYIYIMQMMVNHSQTKSQAALSWMFLPTSRWMLAFLRWDLEVRYLPGVDLKPRPDGNWHRTCSLSGSLINQDLHSPQPPKWIPPPPPAARFACPAAARLSSPRRIASSPNVHPVLHTNSRAACCHRSPQRLLWIIMVQGP